MSLSPLPLAWVAALGLVTGSLAAQQFAEFVRLALPPSRERAAAIAAVDVDGDGAPDLVMASEGAYPGLPVQMLLSLGNARFVDAPVGSLPADRLAVRAIVPFDAELDGDMDLFIACQDFQQNRLWVNDGTGHFTDATAQLPIALDDSRAAIAADLDADGDRDLVIADASGARKIVPNIGGGTFAAAISLPASPSDYVGDLAAADVDGDGDLDLLLANALGTERLLINTGGLAFVDDTAARLPLDSTSTTAVAPIDFDNDGDLDFVVVNHGANDHFLVNDGTGFFSKNVVALPGSDELGADVAVADFDGDGDDDLCVAAHAGVDLLWRNDGAGVFVRVQGPAWPTVLEETSVVTAFDGDGDGDADLVFGGGRSAMAPGRKRFLLNDGAGAFVDATATLWPAGDRETMAIATADLDGDGNLDVLAGGIGGWVEAWFGDGTGCIALDPARMAPSVNGTVQAFAVGDVDRDGDTDVVIGVAGQSALLVNDGTGRLVDDTIPRLPADSADTRDVVMADFDGDLDLDLMLANAGPSPLFAQQNQLWFNDGFGSFVSVTAARLPLRADFSYALDVGDVDGDQDLDVVVGNWHIALPPNPPQPNLLLKNDGFGTFTEAMPGDLPPDFAATAGLALGDLDGDQDLDLVTVHAQGAPDFLYLNDGTGRFTFALGLPGTAPSSSYSVALGDFDDDQDLDVFIGRFDQRNVLIRNDGGGVFVDVSATVLADVSDATAAVAFADIDRDQDMDLLTGNRSFQKDRLLVNRLRQIEVPYLPRIGFDWPVDIYVAPLPGPSLAALWLSPTLRATPIEVPVVGFYHLGMLPPFDIGVVPADPATGVSRFLLSVPLAPALVGQDLYMQGVALPSPNIADVRMTGFWHDVIHD